MHQSNPNNMQYLFLPWYLESVVEPHTVRRNVHFTPSHLPESPDIGPQTPRHKAHSRRAPAACAIPHHFSVLSIAVTSGIPAGFCGSHVNFWNFEGYDLRFDTYGYGAFARDVLFVRLGIVSVFFLGIGKVGCVGG